MILVFVVLLTISTPLVLTALGLWAEPSSEPEITEQNIFYGFQYVTLTNSVDGHVDISGFSYMETSEPNPNKKIVLYLVSDQAAYKIPMQLGHHAGLTAGTTGHNIKGTMHMFSGAFSYFPLKDGIYTLGIYCYENDSTNGYVRTSRQYRKVGQKFVLYDASEVTAFSNQVQDHINVDQADHTSPPSHSIDRCEIAGDAVYINGWAAKIGADSKKATTFLALTDADGNDLIYDSIPYENHYLRDVLDSELYDWAFFNSYIPLVDLHPGSYTLTVIVECDGLWKAQVTHQIELLEDGTLIYTP